MLQARLSSPYDALWPTVGRGIVQDVPVLPGDQRIVEEIVIQSSEIVEELGIQSSELGSGAGDWGFGSRLSGIDEGNDRMIP